MVGGVVSVAIGVINPLIKKLNTLKGDEYKKVKGLRRQVSFLEKELSTINAVLQGLEVMHELNPVVKVRIEHVMEMSYDMENCIDRFMRQFGQEDAEAVFIKKTVQLLSSQPTPRDRDRIVGQDGLRRRKPHGILQPQRASVIYESGPSSIRADGGPERGSYIDESAPKWTDGSENISPIRAAGAGTGEDYVSDDFVGEAMHKMQAAVSRIDELRSNSQLPTIYQVSREYDGNHQNDGIKPVAARIGPLNWSEQDESKVKLQDYKWHCVQQLISLHSSVREPTRTPLLLRKCLNSMLHIEWEIRRFYSGVDVILIDSNRLALMMLLDGCFILHRLLKYAHLPENQADGRVHQLCCSEDNCTERLYGSPQEWELVKRDLLLFENQIPFLVLRKLLEKLEIDESEHNLVKGSLHLLRSSFSCSQMLRRDRSESDMACDQVDHLLHLFYLSVALPPRPTNPAHVAMPIAPQWVFCTKELEEAGVRFRKRENAESFLDIKFDHGVLEIPPLLLDDFSNTLFRNLMTFEESYTTRQCISNYAAFMGDLMKTAEDMQILQRDGILVSMMRDTNSFFNGTRTRMHLPSDNYLLELMENLKKYKGSRRHKWRAELMRSYFRNPCVAIPVFAGTIMLSMTVLQTFFTVYGYYLPRK